MALTDLRILRLEAENVKRLRVVEISPEGEVITLAGRNGQGKTSVLDAILRALGGERPIQWKPIREGEARAHIQLDLGNDEGLQLQVTRTFAAKEDGGFTTSLKVVNAEGFRPDGEQTLLNTLVGRLSFDPSAFMRAKAEEQVAVLKGLVPDFDFAAAEKRRKAVFEERTDATREAKRLESAAGAVIADEVEAIDEAPLMARLEAAGAVAQERAQQAANRQRMAERITAWRTGADRKDREAEALEAQAKQLRESAAEDRKVAQTADEEMAALAPLPELVDTAEVRAQLEAAQANNRQLTKWESKKQLTADAAAQRTIAEGCTKEIEAIDKSVAEAVAAADLPVSGLALGEGMVMLRGVPFEQASDAEQLRTSLALAIAANPRIRVIRIRDGARFDREALEIIREVAKEERFQIWMERVADTGEPDTIIMEAGEVKTDGR